MSNTILPPKNSLEPNNPDDPLPYYYRPFIGFLFRARIEQAFSLLSGPYDSVLELGYGSGIMMPALSKIGKKVYGIDLNSDPVKTSANLRNIGINVTLAKADILDKSFPDESFDLVVAISILEHIPDARAVSETVYRCLKPNGLFLVGMPGVNKFMRAAFSAIGFGGINDHHITSHSQFLKASEDLFKVERFAKIPHWVPFSGGLYFNMLLSKRQRR